MTNKTFIELAQYTLLAEASYADFSGANFADAAELIQILQQQVIRKE